MKDVLDLTPAGEQYREALREGLRAVHGWDGRRRIGRFDTVFLPDLGEPVPDQLLVPGAVAVDENLGVHPCGPKPIWSSRGRIVGPADDVAWEIGGVCFGELEMERERRTLSQFLSRALGYSVHLYSVSLERAFPWERLTEFYAGKYALAPATVEGEETDWSYCYRHTSEWSVSLASPRPLPAGPITLRGWS